MNPRLRAWAVDTGERVLASFGEAVVAAVAAGALAKGVNADTVHVVLIAGLTAGATVLKAALASIAHGTVSPASFAPAQQPGQAEQDAPPAASTDVVEDDTTVAGAGWYLRGRSLEQPVTIRTVVLPEKPVKGKRLGRHIHHDERSRAYPFTPRHTGPLVSVRHKRHVKPFDQGNLGSCTGNACAGALSTAPFTHRYTETHAVAIYEAATRIDNVPGSYPPDDTGSDGISVAKVAQAAGLISRYEHCFDLPTVLAALQVGPVLLGVSWRSGFDNPASDGRMTYTGSIRGGHEICADEIDVANKRVWITNSWGLSWGLAGRAYWTWDDLAKILADQGDATVLVR